MEKRIITSEEIALLATEVAIEIALLLQLNNTAKGLLIAGIPRGGIPAMYSVLAAYNALPVVRSNVRFQLEQTNDLSKADIIIDDLVDSGTTMERTLNVAKPTASFFSLIHKGQQDGFPLGQWLEFPWEVNGSGGSIHDAFTRLLQFIGEDPTRQGLTETPERMAKAWKEWTSGYSINPLDVLRTFEDGAENYDEMIHVAEIPFYSNCEHHLTPFFGTVAFAYVPDKQIVGLSKMSRLVDVFARRLQVQERLTTQIIDTFGEFIKPKGAGITVRARHLCMESRGINRIGCVTTTNRFTGVLKDDSRARMEYLSLTK